MKFNCFLAAIAALLIGSTADAQSNSLFSNSSTGRTTGGTTSGLGTTARGTAGTANSRLGTQQTTGTSQFGSTGGTGGFVGRNSNAGRFVGQQNAAQQTSRSNRNLGGTGRQTGQNSTQNRGGQFGGGTGQQTTLRPVLRVAFQFRQRPQAAIHTRLQIRLQRLALRRPRFRGVSFNLDADGQVVLRGVVTSEGTKTLASNLIRLEPGVRRVKNELVVRNQ